MCRGDHRWHRSVGHCPTDFCAVACGVPRSDLARKGRIRRGARQRATRRGHATKPLPARAKTRFANTQGRALLVDQGGALVLETYGPGIADQTKLKSYSMVKSLVCLLILRALDYGRIASLDDRLPDIVGPTHPNLPLRQVLRMRSGLVLKDAPLKDEVEKPLDDANFMHIHARWKAACVWC